MKCPRCGDESKVIDSRSGGSKFGFDSVRRRRECLACELRFTTYEVHDSGLEDIDKLLSNISRVTEASEKIAGIVKDIESGEVRDD